MVDERTPYYIRCVMTEERDISENVVGCGKKLNNTTFALMQLILVEFD